MEDYEHAAPIWAATLDPQVICVRTQATDANEPLALQIDRYEHHVAISDHAEHVLMRAPGVSLRVDVIGGTVLSGPVIVERIVALE